MNRPPIPPDPCPYCSDHPVLAGHGDPAYPYRKDYGKVWVCPECLARVGCHPNSGKPLGCLADITLRNRKMAAHRWFDETWKPGPRKTMSRSKAYAWLAQELGYRQAHIGWMDVADCERVVSVMMSFTGSSACEPRPES